VACFPDDGRTLDALARADRALYEASRKAQLRQSDTRGEARAAITGELPELANEIGAEARVPFFRTRLNPTLVDARAAARFDCVQSASLR